MNIIGLRKFWLFFAIAMVVISIPLIFIFRPPAGIDFTGGTLIEVKSNQISSATDLRNKLLEIDSSRNYVIQELGTNQYIVRTSLIEGDSYSKFETALGNKNISGHESIGGSVSQAVTRNAIYAIVVASVLIIIYLAYAFRKVPRSVSSWTFGTIAILTLLHDLSFSFALFSILGAKYGFELDSTILVAALTILGFSVHDTIVVFDRIRENIIKNPHKSFAENANSSINQTIARSLNTSLAAILVLVSMIILGGASIKPFVTFLAIGIGIGTYSSIFVSSPLLVIWFEYKNKQKTKLQPVKSRGVEDVSY